jgi:hypothetical protein
MASGGYRENAGRKALPENARKKVVSYSLAPEWISHLEAYADRHDIPKSQAIEEAIVQLLKAETEEKDYPQRDKYGRFRHI